jgi:NADH dehydrogenase FAD-containing subunit
VGGGPTGIEFSAELHDIINEDLARVYPELVPYHKITVYDVATKVLPMFDEKLGKFAMEKFNREGIAIKTSHHVEELRPGAPGKKTVDTGDHKILTLKVKEEGELGVGMVVWSTGLMQNPFVADALNEIRELPKTFELLESGSPQSEAENLHWKVKKDEKTGSVMTDARLRLKLTTSDSTSSAHDAILNDVYAIGDCAILEGTSYPATAQVASQKASWLAKRLNKGDISTSQFSFKNMGVMAYVGDWNALFQGGGGGNISGRLAWVIWRGAYLTKSVSWRNKILIPIYW